MCPKGRIIPLYQYEGDFWKNMKNKQVISEINKKVEHYFSLVKKHRDDENYADAAVNARHILETLLRAYTEQYLPEAAYLKNFDQIEAQPVMQIILWEENIAV